MSREQLVCAKLLLTERSGAACGAGRVIPARVVIAKSSLARARGSPRRRVVRPFLPLWRRSRVWLGSPAHPTVVIAAPDAIDDGNSHTRALREEPGGPGARDTPHRQE